MVSFAKSGWSDLALFGGQPLFKSPLYVGRPNQVDSKILLRRITGALDRNWLTNDGPMVRRLEIKLSQFLGVNHCVAVSSATIGLQLVAKALVLKGDVLLPSFTFIGTANALAWVGLRPVLCDVDPIPITYRWQRSAAGLPARRARYWACICGGGPATSKNWKI